MIRILTRDMGRILVVELKHDWKMEKTMGGGVLLLACVCGGSNPICFDSCDGNMLKFMEQWSMAATLTEFCREEKMRVGEDDRFWVYVKWIFGEPIE